MYQDDKVLQTFLRKIFMYFSLFLLVLGAAIGGCAMINEALILHDDNLVEEYIEIIIENETGLDLDLTPESEEI
jgi:hypothetical protein